MFSVLASPPKMQCLHDSAKVRNGKPTTNLAWLQMKLEAEVGKPESEHTDPGRTLDREHSLLGISPGFLKPITTY